MRRILCVMLLAACAKRPLMPSDRLTGPLPHLPPPAPAAAPAPPHADYAALLRAHDYYRIVSVSPYLQHWRAWYVHNEKVRAYLTAAPDGGGVAFLGSDFGLDEADHQDAFPQAQAKEAGAVRAEVRAHAPAHARIAIEYDGTYREVVVEEIVPHDDPGDPAKRTAAYATLTLTADEALTKITGRGHGVDLGSSDSRLCGYDLRDCAAAPYWIDVHADRDGEPRLWAIFADGADPGPRATFSAAIAAAGAHFLAHDPPPALESL